MTLKIRWTLEIDADTADAETWQDTVTLTDRDCPPLLRKGAELIGLQVKETIERQLLGIQPSHQPLKKP